RETGYRGINITVKSSQNQLFELQFHTEESFRLKTETHNFYEEARQISTSEQRRNEIIKQVIKLATDVKIPKEYRK
ncbi:MAG: ATP nucleotide 3'-pyrophosphokinase, partial [Pyrinomonadaceae bacterium]